MAALDAALDELYAGDAAALERLLRANPALLHARVTSAEGPYCGYFHQATLLHHVAGNPLIQPLPATTTELARLILELGAEVDAATQPGPAQPDDIGWSTLGLVATSDAARSASHQRQLLELLLAYSANIDFRNGGPLVGALYYGEAEAARFLVERGARYDLVTAAGLGRIELMARFVRDDGTLTPDAHALVHYSQVRDRPASRADILGLALIFASMGGNRDAAAWLLDRGASVQARPPFDHAATPLHWAALRGHAEVASLLLDRGADRTVRDTSFDATPQGWAEHAGHQAVAALIAP
ncbi:ankyrin repeat domain-containing protein [Archangium lansingense]|uniref:Ankyrin repeat domain-containing protein n=1 Tax=Archangium lansingense TaxID=2995310 RepID=A0ABT4AMI6_9BACT|nr:ankyrin repeat domain-containing protein [Archangium lansinium]MCY1082059.1 ankyrin repeat domain-containing protein [Archangium lansinium]